MLQPKRVKHRKEHKLKLKGTAQAGSTIVFGDFGLQALERTWLTARQIEAARRAIVHYLRRGVKMWIRVFPDQEAGGDADGQWEGQPGSLGGGGKAREDAF